MNNINAYNYLLECAKELKDIRYFINDLGSLNNRTEYLIKYSIIKSCGTIELAFKTILSDFCSNVTLTQTRNFVNNRIRESSMNPSLENICRSLNNLDANWNLNFRNLLKLRPDKRKLKISLKSLNDVRNDFAHGGNPSPSIKNVIEYYYDAITIIKILDQVVV